MKCLEYYLQSIVGTNASINLDKQREAEGVGVKMERDIGTATISAYHPW